MRRLLLATLATILQAQDPRAVTLPNRMRLVLRLDEGLPLVRARLSLPVPAHRRSLAEFALEAVDRSATGGHGRAAFHRALDHAGLRLTRTLAGDRVVWELLAPPQGLDAGLALLADQVLRAQVDGGVLERVRLRAFRDLQDRTPAQRALVRAQARLGTGPYPPMDEALLTQSGQGEVDAVLQDLLRPEAAVLEIQGAATESQARTAAWLQFGAWPPGRAPAAGGAPGPRPRLTLVPGGVALAWVGVDLGDAPRAVRDLLGLALEAGAAPVPGAVLERHGSGFAYRLQGGDPLANLEALGRHLDGLASVGLGPEAWAAARARYLAARAVRGLHPGLPVDGTADAAEAEVRAMDLPGFNTALRKVLDPGRRLAVVGGLRPKDGADPRLAGFGPPETWFEARGAFVGRDTPSTGPQPPRR
ncbi:MAG: hypothetical protein U0P81_11075 [Holophagaceae bacterium]